ncbi:anti-sigma factor family protein [Actinomadura sp. NTSP31]|uniref:anti-sigma factor family protein n=1 Tax=Actinomadura sp. NTSP31 TaxID=1735447 RepID=UPI0035C1FFC0
MNPAHLDYDVLADLAEGLLEGDQAASVNAHLESCAECRDRSADLADVSRILAEAPVPSMPAELAERIDTAIAAESMHNATVVSMEQRRGRRHWRILSAAAAAVVVLGGGAAVGKIALNGSDGTAGRASAPAQDNEKRHEAGGSAPNAVAPSQSALSAASFKVTRSGTAYRAGRLGGQIDRLLGKGQELRLQGSPPTELMSGCVTGVTRGRTPALVDQATYDGRDATVIALPGARSGSWDVWVVGPDCSAQDAHVLEHEPA